MITTVEMDWARYYHELALLVMLANENAEKRADYLDKAVKLVNFVHDMPVYRWDDDDSYFPKKDV